MQPLLVVLTYYNSKTIKSKLASEKIVGETGRTRTSVAATFHNRITVHDAVKIVGS